MKQPHPEIDLSTLIIHGYDAANGVYTSQVDPVGPGGSNQPGEARHPYGFLGVPNDGDADDQANTTNGAYALTVKEGSTLHAFPFDDNRVTSTLPQTPKGGSLHYGSKGTASGPSWCQHDGNGNYKGHVPTGCTLTLELEGGPSIVISGTTIQIGGSGAVPLGLGSALGAVINAILGCTPSGTETGLASVKLALAAFTTPNTYETQEAMGV